MRRLEDLEDELALARYQLRRQLGEVTYVMQADARSALTPAVTASAREHLTFEIVCADEAFVAAQAFMAEDPAGLAIVSHTVDDLASNPRPPSAFPRGSTAFLRLRVGRYRVL
ncbi:MAG: hypothetical protein H7231_09050 [Rhodoferax sp.]|nr:hypothetical protein [Actinomycetota bacterium]